MIAAVVECVVVGVALVAGVLAVGQRYHLRARDEHRRRT